VGAERLAAGLRRGGGREQVNVCEWGRVRRRVDGR
jgi:hypothetical protein